MNTPKHPPIERADTITDVRGIQVGQHTDPRQTLPRQLVNIC